MIANRLSQFPVPAGGYHFLLASSPKAETSAELIKAFSKIGNTIPYACPTQVFGYPEGPTAMFWDCMDFIAKNFSGQPGFSLWLESDMAPTQADWIDRLSAEWFAGTDSGQPTPIMMGCYVPEVYKHRLFKKRKLILHPHINGGACYALDFANQMPTEARNGVFDMAVFQYAQNLGRAKFTRQIAFSTAGRVRRDVQDPTKVLLHGFMQDKDRFIAGCLEPLTSREKKAATWHPVWDQLETLQRQIRVKFVRKGHRAMLENMFLAKQKFEAEENLKRVVSDHSHSPAFNKQVA